MTLREFAARRRKDILLQIKALREELAQLKAIQAYPTSSPSQASSAKPASALTFQEMIIEILCEKPNGATAQEILRLIDTNFGKKIMRSSISPQLSRLKDKSVLSLEDGIWKLTAFGQDLKKPATNEQHTTAPTQTSMNLRGENELPLDEGDEEENPLS